MVKRTDHRSKEAALYRSWYASKRWKAKRLAQLLDHPVCVYCDAAGLVVSASVADHVVPHKGDLDLFWHGELQSLCKHCHDSHKQTEEGRGYSMLIDIDGYPVDPRHPANR